LKYGRKQNSATNDRGHLYGQMPWHENSFTDLDNFI